MQFELTIEMTVRNNDSKRYWQQEILKVKIKKLKTEKKNNNNKLIVKN